MGMDVIQAPPQTAVGSEPLFAAGTSDWILSLTVIASYSLSKRASRYLLHARSSSNSSSFFFQIFFKSDKQCP